MSLIEKLKGGLQKTRKGITEKVEQLLVSFGMINEDLFEELEEVLIAADIGVQTSMNIISNIRKKVKEDKITQPASVKDMLKSEILKILNHDEAGKSHSIFQPRVIVVMGVNGAGKTTTIAKLSRCFKQEGKKVLLAAGDTFRAAAIEQLEVWAQRTGVDVIKQSQGSDPAAVVFDAVQAAKARNSDVIICDTAGRLHTKKNLMEELKKILRVLKRELPDASHENLLVIDATTGQNAVSQTRTFSECIDVTGIVLTKLDGTAKGGIVIAIKSELDIPVKYIGVGEGMDDLQVFDAQQFVTALFE